MPSPADPIAFTLGPLEVRWYALFILSGILLGLLVVDRVARWRDQDPNFISEVTPVVILAAVLGARLYFVLLEWRFFRHHPGQIIGLQLHGLTIHGALAAGIGTFWWICHQRKQPFLRWADTIVVGIPVGQALGRLGNWANQEAFGRPTNLPWGLKIDPGHRPVKYLSSDTFHPTFLYEMICSLLLAGLLAHVLYHYAARGWWRDGYALALYLICYGAIRWVIESLRTDSLRIGPWPAAYWLSLGLILSGVSLAMYQYRKPRHDRQPEPATI
jgi:phosphatidylglycerol:prolipoprotein diacylglycerol transferase